MLCCHFGWRVLQGTYFLLRLGAQLFVLITPQVTVCVHLSKPQFAIFQLTDLGAAAGDRAGNNDLLNTAHIKKALEELVDISAPKINDKLIERFVEVVTPIENYSYRWKLNFGEKVSRKDRTDLCKIESAPILSFKITFQEAHEYRKANKMPAQFTFSKGSLRFRVLSLSGFLENSRFPTVNILIELNNTCLTFSTVIHFTPCS